jgi:4-amino-4-deoxy-L-arabinose transferase-like glycosyltransferase
MSAHDATAAVLPALRPRWLPARRLVLLVSLVVLVGKLILAATTYGTNDINHWHDFVDGVRRAGPIGVYGIDFPHSLYNHGPLTGYLLVGVNWLSDVGLRFNFTIRALSGLADVATALLVFEIVRRRRELRAATWAGVGIAASPLLFIISGFHGNTDPIFTMLVVLTTYLLMDRRAPLLAGIALGLAISLKVVPVVVLPAVLVYGFRTSRRVSTRLASGLALVFLLLWVPALISHFHNIVTNVFGYSGGTFPQWGLGELANLVGGQSLVNVLTGPVRLVIVGLCAIGPAMLVWRRPDTVIGAVAISLAGFLALTPGFGTQYLVWGLALCYLLTVRGATAYNLAAGALLFVVYTRQNKGIPWDRAYSDPMVAGERAAALIVWTLLVGCVAWGIRSAWTAPPSDPSVKLACR